MASGCGEARDLRYRQDMETPGLAPRTGEEGLADYPLLTALRERRSRRFGLGMKMPEGPLAWESPHPPRTLTEAEEAALVFAACGATGHALADLCYAPGGGGGIMGGLVGRTVASGDGLQTVALVVTDDAATYLIRRPRELPPPEGIATLIELGRAGARRVPRNPPGGAKKKKRGGAEERRPTPY